jgi:hypothetical protein
MLLVPMLLIAVPRLDHGFAILFTFVSFKMGCGDDWSLTIIHVSLACSAVKLSKGFPFSASCILHQLHVLLLEVIHPNYAVVCEKSLNI